MTYYKKVSTSIHFALTASWQIMELWWTHFENRTAEDRSSRDKLACVFDCVLLLPPDRKWACKIITMLWSVNVFLLNVLHFNLFSSKTINIPISTFFNRSNKTVLAFHNSPVHTAPIECEFDECPLKDTVQRAHSGHSDGALTFQLCRLTQEIAAAQRTPPRLHSAPAVITLPLHEATTRSWDTCYFTRICAQSQVHLKEFCLIPNYKWVILK